MVADRCRCCGIIVVRTKRNVGFERISVMKKVFALVVGVVVVAVLRETNRQYDDIVNHRKVWPDYA